MGNNSTDFNVRMKQIDLPFSRRHYCGFSRQLSPSSSLMALFRQPRDQRKFSTTKDHSRERPSIRYLTKQVDLHKFHKGIY